MRPISRGFSALKVWLALLAMTAVEVWLCYIQLSTAPMLTLLVGLSMVKAALSA